MHSFSKELKRRFYDNDNEDDEFLLMNWFCRTVDQGNTWSLISSWDHRQRMANLRHAVIRTIVRGWQTSDTPLSGPSSKDGKPPTRRYQDHRQRMANLRHPAIGTIVRGWQISDTPLLGFELEQKLNWGFFEWSCAVLINTHHATTKQWIRQQVLRFLQFCNGKLRNVSFLTFNMECTRKILKTIKSWKQEKK